MNRIDRLFALILYLQSRRVVTAEQLAAHFELSVRTIYRDLVALGEAGIPIVAEAGVGYSLMRGFHLPPVNFTTEEAMAVMTGGLLLNGVADASLNDPMVSAMFKIRSILPAEQRESLARLERVMATTANAVQPPQADLSRIQQAIADRSLLRFEYQGAGQSQKRERIVEPHALIHYLDRWHLIAWCRVAEGYRDFRTDRISEFRTSSEAFALREDFSLVEYIRSMPKPELRARLRFSSAAADRAKREWWLGIVNEEQGPNGIELTLASVEWEPLVRWLLSFGRDVIVVEPSMLRELLAESARDTADHHGNSKKF